MKKPKYLHHSTGIIPQINFRVEIDCYYRLLKDWGGVISDSFELDKKEVSDIQKYLLNWLVDQFKERLLGSITFIFWCEKYGTPEAKSIHVDEIQQSVKGWKLIEHY